MEFDFNSFDILNKQPPEYKNNRKQNCKSAFRSIFIWY